MEYVDIGPCPAGESCAQVGEPDYHNKAMKECKKYIRLIRKVIGKEPDGARLDVKSFPHDFGTYHEVVCYHNASSEAIEYAYKCESEAPDTWDGE